MDDLDARQVAQLYRLAGEREGAGDDRLRGDDRGHGGEHQQREPRPTGCEEVEGIDLGALRREDEGALSEIVERQGDSDQAEPVDLDRALAEVAEVGVEGLASGRDEEDRTENEKSGAPPVSEKADRVHRVDRREHGGIAQDSEDAEDRQSGEPDEHHGTEDGSDPGRSPALEEEESDEDRDAGRHDEPAERGLDDRQPLDGSQHRDGRRQHAVGVEQRGAEEPDAEQPVAPADRDLRAHQRHERQDAPFAPVVGAEDVDVVLERDDEDQGPDDQRHHAEDVLAGRGHPVFAVEALADRVEGAGSDIAVDHAERGQGEDRETRVLLVDGLWIQRNLQNVDSARDPPQESIAIRAHRIKDP